MKTTLKTTFQALAMVAAVFLSLVALAPSSGAQATDGASTDGYVPDNTDGVPVGPTATVLPPGTDGNASNADGNATVNNAAATNVAAAPATTAALPRTGGNSMETAQLAFGLVAAGGVFILLGRRRSDNG